jgi:hypothetical protein
MRLLLAAAAAGTSALLTCGLATAGAYAAGQGTHASNPIIYTNSQAGYTTTGGSFRFISTTFTVPAKAYSGGYAEVVLGGAKVVPASLGVAAGGGSNSVVWNVVGPIGEGMAGGTMNIAPKAGDVVTESIYYNQKGLDYFTVADLTQHQTVTVSAPPASGVVYTAAEAACLLTKPMPVPATDVRLWEFTKSAATTYAGVHGTLNGPWTTNQVIDVNSAGKVVMSPSLLWNNGQNFGAWLRAAS